MDKILLYIYGLVAFVPQVSETHWTILLPDARYPSLASPGCSTPAHVPAIIFFVGERIADTTVGGEAAATYEYCTPLENKKDCEWNIDHIEPRSGYGGWMLNGQDVRMEQRELKSAAITKPRKGTMPRDADEAASFDWAPRMTKVHGRSAAVNLDCLGPDPETCPIAGRFILDNARPRTCHLATTGDPKSFYAFNFTKVTTPDRRRSKQALTDITAIEWSNASKAGTHLWAVPLGQTDTYKVREILLKPDANGVVMHLINMPANYGDYPRTKVPLCDDLPAMKPYDLHFESYYQLMPKSDLVQVEDRRAAMKLDQSLPGEKHQPNCGLKIPDDLFGRHKMTTPKFDTPIRPPACPPVVLEAEP